MTLVLCRYLTEYTDRLRAEAPPGYDIHHAVDEADFRAHLPEAEVVYGHVDMGLFHQAAKLRWLQIHSTGYDAYDNPMMHESSLVITGIRGLLADTVAEHTLALMLALSRRIDHLRDQQVARQWKVIPGFDLAGSTACIVGLGAIGRRLVGMCAGLGMRVIAVEPAMESVPAGVERVESPDRLHAALAETRVLLVCCPLVDETRGLIDSAALAALPAGAYVVGISRGGVIDEPALIAALSSGHLAGAALDVCQHEPCLPEDPLWSAPGLILTPHCAGYSQHTLPRKVDRFLENLRRWAQGEPLVDVLPVTQVGRLPESAR